jgi:uncharacterized alpha-E superfamily protein
MLLSRVAERVYWQARYLERVENTARLLNVFSGLLLDLPSGTKLGWRTLVQITGTENAFDSKYKQSSERNVVRFLLAENNGLSILDILESARESARTTREVMPTEAFEQINELYYFAKENATAGVDRGERYQLLEEIINRCQQIWGLMAGTMSRDAAYSFVRIGRALERADMTTRIVDVGSGNLLPAVNEGSDSQESSSEPYENILWMNILRSQSAYQMYRQHVRFRVNAVDVVSFLLLNEEFPRSTHHNLITLDKVLNKLPNNGKVARQINKTKRILKNADIEELLQNGLLDHIDNLQLELADIHFKIAETWFLPNK